MKILSVNAGSSSLKFRLYEMPEEKLLVKGMFERIGLEDSSYNLRLGEDKISTFLINRSILGPIVSGVIGFVPNCASSVIITELYLNNALTFGSAISGLLCASGLGILVLFKMNKNYKENVLIVFILYTISVLVGIIFNVLQVTI